MTPHPEFPNIDEGATTADLYNRAVEIGVSGDRKLGRKYFLALVDLVLRHSLIPNMTREKAEGVVFTNIEYWLQHHPEADADAVKKLYLQIMGTFRAYTYEEMEACYNQGYVSKAVNGAGPPREGEFEEYMNKVK